MSAVPAEPIKIGPALFESASAAVRHWPIAFLGLTATSVWNGLVLIAVTGCTSAVACLGPWPPSELYDWMRLGVWLGTRFIGWFVLGGVVYHILTWEAGLEAIASERRAPRLRLFLACVLCFASASLAVFAARAAVIFGSPALGYPEGDLLDSSRPISLIAEGVIVILIWSYLSARFAVFAASILRRGESAGFGRSWAEAQGIRLSLFLMFLAIHLPLVTIQGLVFRNVPQISDQNRFVGLVMYSPFAAVGAALTAGVFVMIFRRLAGSEVRVFD